MTQGFWSYVVQLVPIYILVTLIGLACLREWLNGRFSLLAAIFVSGMFSYVFQPLTYESNLLAYDELGGIMYFLLIIVSCLLWIVGLYLFFLVRSFVDGVLERLRLHSYQRSHPL